MLRPSYTDLLTVINADKDVSDYIISRYTIVVSVAKRARQLVDHQKPLVTDILVDKPVSIAVQELHEGKIKVKNAAYNPNA